MSRVFGVDLGYGFVKVTDGNQEHVFPSVVGVGQKIRYHSDLGNHHQVIENLSVRMEDDHYFVGDLAIRQSGIASRSLDPDRCEDPNVRVLFVTALGLYAHWEEDEFHLVTGLPTGQFGARREEWMTALRGKHAIHFGLNGTEKERQLFIKDLRVIPQPFGTLYHRVLNNFGSVDDRELAAGRVGIVDIGFKTSDFAVADQMEFIDHLSTSTNTALSTAYGIVAAHLRHEFNLERENYRLDRVMQNGELRIAGRSQDLRKIRQKALGDVAQKIAAEINSLWDYRDLDHILITGGGGKALAEFLQREFPNAELVSKPQFANACGFWKLANHLFRQAQMA